MCMNQWMQQLAPWIAILGIGATLLLEGFKLRRSSARDESKVGWTAFVGGCILILFGLAGLVIAAWNFLWPFGALCVIILALAIIVGVIVCLKRPQLRIRQR